MTTLTQNQVRETKLFDKSRREETGRPIKISDHYDPSSDASLYLGDCLELLENIPTSEAGLVVTSPPYNIGKEYEKKINLDDYVAQQEAVIEQAVRVLADTGNLCWQVGNYVDKGEIVPLDYLLYPVFKKFGLQMRNRVVWHFEHGLHCSRRFSGRYEVIAWFTKSNNYWFDLDPVRVPQKYPGKRHFKGPKAGQLSCNPKGKNPGDHWVIPNVKHNHVEKTIHPCQFPVELIERLVLSMTRPDELVVDPFMGVGSAAVAAVRHRRRAAGAELDTDYHEISLTRLDMEWEGELRTRPMGKAVYEPK